VGIQTSEDGNALSSFSPESFTIMTFCESCGHQGKLDRAKVPPGITVQQLRELLRCSKCGSKAGSIRIVYTGAGGFAHT
jgi:ribosomal protein S14